MPTLVNLSETQIGIYASIGVLGLAVTCLLWMLGGRSNKWIRRYAGGVVLVTTVIMLCLLMNKYSNWLLVMYVTTIVGFSMGYGGDNLEEKLRRRITFVVGNMGSSLLMSIVLGVWTILPLHLMIALGTVWLGIKNPVHAASEEVFVCLLLNAGLIMYPFVM